MSIPLLVALMVALTTISATGAKSYPPVIEDAEELVYKRVDGVDLKLWVFRPDTPPEKAPAMIFFFGGGWNGGSPQQFVHHGQYLAERGMYGVVADYRVKSRHGVKAKSCVEDAGDALRYVQQNAGKLGIDPERIGVGGGSAGGHLAACLGTLEAQHRQAPDAMALFNPATILAPIEIDRKLPAQLQTQLAKLNQRIGENQASLNERMGTDSKKLSPFHHVRKQSPPTIIFHGTADTTVPYATAMAFTRQLETKKVKVVARSYQGQKHGFFNREPFRSQTLRELDDFLVGLAWLPAKTD